MSRPSAEAHELVDAESNAEDAVVASEPDGLSSSIPKPDGGRDAWLFLASCFVLEALIWGFPFSYGVFLTYYTAHPPFAAHPTAVAAVGTTQAGLMYFGAPLAALLMQRWPSTRRPGMLAGAVVAVAGLVGASFCDSVGALLATQGVCYAVGGLVLYYPQMAFVDEWFVARKGLAYGVMWAGSGSAGVVVPFVLEWLLGRYGFRTALRVWAVVLAFLRHAPFWLFLAGSILQSLAFFLPPLYLPSFALSLHLPPYAGPLALALVNLSACLGAITIGLLIDRFHVCVALGAVTLGQTIAIFLVWGLTTSQPPLYLFAVLWGLSGGGFSSTWSGYGTAVGRGTRSGRVDAALLLSLMAARRGVGAVITGPVSETLLRVGWKTGVGFAYGTEYGVLIVFAGVFATLGGVACVGRLFKVL